MPKSYFKVLRASVAIAIALTLSFLMPVLHSNAQGLPELMYFKFDAAPGGVITNHAPAGTQVCPSGSIVGNLTVSGTGQFGAGLEGYMGSSSTNYVNTGWATSLTGSWTISLWLGIPNPPTTRYYFGDNTASSFRCFTGGAAGTGLRLTGPFTITTSTIQPGPSVVHYVYDATAGTVSAYINGVFNISINVSTTLSINGSNFKVGAYATGNGFEGTIDEFRMYNRALTAAEIAATWNQQLPLGPPCNAPTGLNATAITQTGANTSWGAVSGSIGYEYDVTTSATPPATGTATTATTYNATGLTPNTNYYLHVRNKCAATTFSSWATYPFSTLACATPVVTTGSITPVSANISWPAISGSLGYEYDVSTSATPPASGTATTNLSYNATGLTPNTSYYAHVRNQCTPTAFSAWTTVPFSTPALPPCPAPATLNVINITQTSADLNWTAATGVTDYEYAVTTSPVGPTSGTAITGTAQNVSGLQSGTSYYAHIRSDCGSGNYSIWTTTPFTTQYPPCLPPSPAVSNVTKSSATINWPGLSGAVNYEYEISTSPTPPAGGALTTTATSIGANALTHSTTYYVHIRTNCGGGGFSPWATINFTTLLECLPPVPTVTEIVNNTAQINWNSVLGATVYQYAVVNSSTTPASITSTPGTSISVGGLTANATYYIHMRSICANDSSGWAIHSFKAEPFTTSVKTSEVKGINLKVYPNPTQNILTIETDNRQGKAMIIITDVTGKNIYTKPVNDDKTNINISTLPAAVYMLKYTDESYTEVIRVVKQ